MGALALLEENEQSRSADKEAYGKVKADLARVTDERDMLEVCENDSIFDVKWWTFVFKMLKFDYK